MVFADKKWNSRAVHKEVRSRDHLTARLRNGRAQIVSVKRGASVACGLPLANWADARKERVRAEELCCRIDSRFGEIFLRTPPSAAAQEREPSLRVLPTGQQVLLVESLDEIGTQVLAEESLEEHIGPVDHIDHERLHLLVAETRQF